MSKSNNEVLALPSNSETRGTDKKEKETDHTDSECSPPN